MLLDLLRVVLLLLVSLGWLEVGLLSVLGHLLLGRIFVHSSLLPIRRIHVLLLVLARVVHLRFTLVVRHELLTLLLAQELTALRQEFLLLVVALARRRLPLLLLGLIGGLGRGRLLLHLLLVSHRGAVLLDPLLEHFEHVTSLLKALALLKEALVQLRQMEFFLSIGQRLKLHEIAVGQIVGGLKDLVLLQEHLEGGFVGEVAHGLFEFEEVLNVAEDHLHAVKGLADGLVDGEQVAGGAGLALVSLVVVAQVLVDAGLAERQLMAHAESVDHRVVLIAVEHARGDRRLRGLLVRVVGLLLVDAKMGLLAGVPVQVLALPRHLRLAIALVVHFVAHSCSD